MPPVEATDSSETVSGIETGTFWPLWAIVRPPGHWRTCSTDNSSSPEPAVAILPVSASVNVLPGFAAKSRWRALRRYL